MLATAPVDARRRAQDAGIRLAEPERSPPTGAPPARLRRVHDRLEDWLAGYPDTLAVRIVHRAPLVLWRLGLGGMVGDLVLTTRGRASGLPRRIAIGPHRIDGRQYLWDPYGDRAHWYRNLVADPVVTIQDTHGTWTARAVHPSEHDEAVALYAEIGRVIGRRFDEYLADLGVEDSPEGFARDIDSIHVVRLDSVDGPGPPPQPADLVWVWPVAGAAGLLSLLAKRHLRVAVAGGIVAIGALIVPRGLDLLARLGNALVFGRKPVGPIAKWLFQHDPMHASTYPIVLDKLALDPEDYYLDLACGGGKLLAEALRTVDRAAGLDHSSAAVEAAREFYASEIAEGRLDVREGDAGDLPWEDGSFAAVSIANAMHLIEEPVPVLREAHRVLEPGGRFVVITQAKEPIEGLLWAPIRHAMTLYTDAELMALLADVGFTDVEAYPTGDMAQVGYGVKG